MKKSRWRQVITCVDCGEDFFYSSMNPNKPDQCRMCMINERMSKEERKQHTRFIGGVVYILTGGKFGNKPSKGD